MWKRCNIYSKWINPIFTEFYNKFYINKVKSVPTYLTPLALAHWIMQDGAKGSSGVGRFYRQLHRY